MAHRYAAGLLGVLVLGLGVLAWRRRPPGRVPAAPLFLIALVAFQALLGMWTVTLRLAPPRRDRPPARGARHRRAAVVAPAARGPPRSPPPLRSFAAGRLPWPAELGARRGAGDRPADRARRVDQRELRGARVSGLPLVPGPAPASARLVGRLHPVARGRRWRLRRRRARQRGAGDDPPRPPPRGAPDPALRDCARAADTRLGRGAPPQGRGRDPAPPGRRAGRPRNRERAARPAHRGRGGAQRRGHPRAALGGHCVPYGPPAPAPPIAARKEVHR